MYSEIIRFFLKEAPEVKEPPKIFLTNIHCVLSLVSSRAKINIEAIKGAYQGKEVVFARHCYFVIAREKTKEPFREIGKVVNKKYSNVITCIKRAKNCPEFVKEFNRLFDDIMTLSTPVILRERPVRPIYKVVKREINSGVVEIFDSMIDQSEVKRPAKLSQFEYGAMQPFMGYKN